MQDHNVSPFNTLPGTVILLAAALFGVEMVFTLAKSGLIGGTRGGDDWRSFAFQDYGFSGNLFDAMLQTGRWPLDGLMRFVTYAFVHGSFTHMAFVCVFVLALGKMVGEVFNGAAVLTVFLAATVAGALAFGLLLSGPRLLVGGYPGAYGLIGAYTLILWVGYGQQGGNQYRAFTLIGFLLAIQLIFGLMFGVSNDWVADLAGFVTGFGVSVLIAPGSLRRLVAKLRER